MKNNINLGVVNYGVVGSLSSLQLTRIEELDQIVSEDQFSLLTKVVEGSTVYELIFMGSTICTVEKMLLDINSSIIFSNNNNDQDPRYSVWYTNGISVLFKLMIQRFVSSSILKNNVRNISSKEIAGHQTTVKSCSDQIRTLLSGSNIISLYCAKDFICIKDNDIYAYFPLSEEISDFNINEADLIPKITIFIEGHDLTQDFVSKLKQSELHISNMDRAKKLSKINDVLNITTTTGVVSNCISHRKSLFLCMNDIYKVQIFPFSFDVSEVAFIVSAARKRLYDLSFDRDFEKDSLVSSGEQFSNLSVLLSTDIAKSIINAAIYGHISDSAMLNDKSALEHLLNLNTFNHDLELPENDQYTGVNYLGVPLSREFLTKSLYTTQELEQGFKEAVEFLYFCFMLLDDSSLIRFNGEDKFICSIDMRKSSAISLVVPFLGPKNDDVF